MDIILAYLLVRILSNITFLQQKSICFSKYLIPFKTIFKVLFYKNKFAKLKKIYLLTYL